MPKRSIDFLHIDIGISFDPYNLINFVSVLFVNFVVHPMKNITNDENYIEHSKAYQFPALFLAPPTLVFPAPPDVKHLWSIRDLDFRYPSPTGIMVFHSENCQSFLRICIDFWKNKRGVHKFRGVIKSGIEERRGDTKCQLFTDISRYLSVYYHIKQYDESTHCIPNTLFIYIHTYSGSYRAIIDIY